MVVSEGGEEVVASQEMVLLVDDVEAAATAEPKDGAVTAKSEMSWDFFTEEFGAMWHLAWPMLVTYGCRIAIGVTDVIFVGHIESSDASYADYLSAAALASVVHSVLLAIPHAFGMSVLNALVSQSMGAGKPKLAGIWLQIAMFVGAVAFIPTLIAMSFTEDILLGLGFSPKICALAGGVYTYIQLIWPIPNMWYQCFRAYFQCQGITVPAMVNSLCFFFINALLSYLFIFAFAMGFEGSAVALTVSRSLQPVTYCIYMFGIRKYHLNAWPDGGWSLGSFTSARLKEYFRMGVPNIGSSLAEALADSTVTLFIASMGVVDIASASAADFMAMLFSLPCEVTLRATATVRVGHHTGKGNANSARLAANMVIAAAVLASLLLCMLYLPLKQELINVFTSSQDVRAEAPILLVTLALQALPQIVFGVVAGAFAGQGRMQIESLLYFFLLLPCTIGFTALFIFYWHWPLLTVYWGKCVVTVATCVVASVIFYRSKWALYVAQTKTRQDAAAK